LSIYLLFIYLFLLSIYLSIYLFILLSYCLIYLFIYPLPIYMMPVLPYAFENSQLQPLTSSNFIVIHRARNSFSWLGFLPDCRRRCLIRPCTVRPLRPALLEELVIPRKPAIRLLFLVVV